MTEHKEVEGSRSDNASTLERDRVTALSGLPRPARVGVIAVIGMVVGVAALCQAGVLAPRFKNAGGGSGGPIELVPRLGAQREADQVGWAVLRNVGWRDWRVTAVDLPDQDARAVVDVVVFVKPAETSVPSFPEQLAAAARTPVLTHLPLTVPAGRSLVLYGVGKAGSCADRHPLKARPSVSIDTWFGQRSIQASLFIGCP